MKLWIYAHGEQTWESPRLTRIKRGPLFCMIEFNGDGTPGTIQYSQEADLLAGSDRFHQQRIRIEKSLATEEIHYWAGGGQVESDGKVLFYDNWATALPWTKDHIENGLMSEIGREMIVSWDENADDRVIESFPPRNSDSPRRVRSCNKHLVE